MTARAEEKALATAILMLATTRRVAADLTPAETYHAMLMAAEAYRGRQHLPPVDVAGLAET